MFGVITSRIIQEQMNPCFLILHRVMKELLGLSVFSKIKAHLETKVILQFSRIFSQAFVSSAIVVSSFVFKCMHIRAFKECTNSVFFEKEGSYKIILFHISYVFFHEESLPFQLYRL